MARGGSTAAERQLEEANGTLAREIAEREQHERDLEAAVGLREELADQPDAFTANEQRIVVLRSEVKRRAIVIQRREADAVAAKAELDRAVWVQAVAERDNAAEAARKIVEKFASDLEQLNDRAIELLAARQKAADLAAYAEERRPSGEAATLVADEPNFSASALVAVLTAGPWQPQADAEARAKARDRVKAARDAEKLETALTDDLTWPGERPVGERAIDRLPDHLREEAERRYVEGMAERANARHAREERRDGGRVRH